MLAHTFTKSIRDKTNQNKRSRTTQSKRKDKKNKSQPIIHGSPD